MKKATALLVLTFLIFQNLSFGQGKSEDQLRISFLRNFYISYNNAWHEHLPSLVVKKKLHSLLSIYCTSQFEKEVYDELLDHDIITKDHMMDAEHLKTLNIVKDKTPDSFIVTFIDHTTQGGTPIDLRAILHVTLTKEKSQFKIASVE